MHSVTDITWNWSPACMEGTEYSMECYTDSYESASMCDDNVLYILEYTPSIEGDKFYYDIYFTNKDVLRIFNPNTVTYKEG